MSKTIVEILNSAEMAGFVKSNGTQCRFVSLTINTAPKLKKGCPFQGVRKIARKIGIINANYNTSVRNRIASQMGVTLSEVEYENGDVWYEHLKTIDGKALPLVQNKNETKREGKLYLQYFPHRSEHCYIDSEGKTITEEQLEPYFYARSEKPDYKPSVIVVELSNVVQMKASGVIVQTADLEEAEAILAQ